LQLKPSKKSFATIDDWLDSLPNSPWEEDLTAELPGYAEYPILKLSDKLLPCRKEETDDDAETTLSEVFDGMRIEITGPAKKARRSLNLIFETMKL